jgi:signal transduction histidine kinase
LDEANHAEFTRHSQAATRAKGFLADFEFKMQRRDGKVFLTEHSVVPVRNEAGKVVSWVNLVRDITERKQAEEEARQLPRRIIEAQENERLRVARELHDGVNQIIAATHMRLRKVESRLAMANPAAREMLARCDELLVQALEENRRIAHDLRPSDLDTLGLAEACRNFCREFQGRVDLKLECEVVQDGERLDAATELNLFRIVQEALNNIEKHARAKIVKLRLIFQPDFVLLRIQDDGCGFPTTMPSPKRKKGHGLGLTNMRERAMSLGGIFELESIPNERTTILVRVPRKRRS